jgi:RimJ/RimL family protein N-acetyltransferase
LADVAGDIKRAQAPAGSKLELRAWSEGDLALLERLMGDPGMTEHLGGPESPEKIRDRHRRYLRGFGEGGMFVIAVGREGSAAGSIGYWSRQWQGEQVWETGWSVLPEFQGRGIATEATTIIVERARTGGTHRSIHAFPSVDNAASNAICRRASFTLQGQYDFEYPPGHMMRCNDWSLDLF